MQSRKIFSIPLNPKLDQNQFMQFYNFCSQYKDWIYDIYFTSRIAPFKQDAMGDIFIVEESNISAIETALNIQKHLGIPISATFNNTTVPPTQENLDTFISNFKKLYDAGVHSVTIPHTHWVATNQLKAAFPKLFIKNTILREVRSAQEIVNLAKYGFDYINLDRNLMRDRDALLQIKKAKKYIKDELGKEIKISLLANEGCLGECPMMVEHFEFNNTRQLSQPQYFNDPISRVSCPKWDVEDPAIALKTANFSPWKADWDEYLELGIDVFKMHGREDISRLTETLTLIDNYANGSEILNSGFMNWVNETNLTGKPIELWREKIKNCKFECWECQYCDKIHEKKSPLDYSDLVKHTVVAIADSGVPTVYNKIPGLTSPRVQTLLNNLAKGVGTYLEIGSFLGATGCAVLTNNPLTAYFIDAWEEEIQPQRSDMPLPKNSYNEFVKNINEYKGSSNVNIINSKMFDVDTTAIRNSIQMFFYDGPHDFESTRQAILYYYSTFANEAILVFDDANWEGVVDGAVEGLNECGAHITYQKLMLNSEENKKEWWNGLYIAVIRK